MKEARNGRRRQRTASHLGRQRKRQELLQNRLQSDSRRRDASFIPSFRSTGIQRRVEQESCADRRLQQSLQSASHSKQEQELYEGKRELLQ